MRYKYEIINYICTTNPKISIPPNEQRNKKIDKNNEKESCPNEKLRKKRFLRQSSTTSTEYRGPAESEIAFESNAISLAVVCSDVHASRLIRSIRSDRRSRRSD